MAQLCRETAAVMQEFTRAVPSACGLALLTMQLIISSRQCPRVCFINLYFSVLQAGAWLCCTLCWSAAGPDRQFAWLLLRRTSHIELALSVRFPALFGDVQRGRACGCRA